MDSIIYDLWEEFIQYGYNIRAKGKDGKIGWDTIKGLIPDMKVEWTGKSKTFYTALNALGVNISETPEEANMLKEEWERHHYLIQHGRIINKYAEGSLIRLLQIAYNIGQFRKELEKKTYPSEQLKFYIENELNKVTTYIEKIGKLPADIVVKLKEAFSLNLSGGYIPNYHTYLQHYIHQLSLK